MSGPAEMSNHSWLPRSLRLQFRLILTALAVLIIAGSFTAVQALRESARITRQLAEERLVQMEAAREMAHSALLIERDMHRLLAASATERMNENYKSIVAQLEQLDSQSRLLGLGVDDISVLSLYQSEQNFRNIVHIVAGLRSEALRAGLPAVPSAALRRFRDELERLATEMVSVTETLASRSNEKYRIAVRHLAATAEMRQRWVLMILAGSLAAAWLISRVFLEKQVLKRLLMVSSHLLRSNAEAGPATVPVQGKDEIAEMARAVERFLEDRRRLGLVNEALELSLKEIKILRGILPICSGCKKIRDDKGYWTQLEMYIHEHSEVAFSHGICPECMAKLYPEYWDKMQQNQQTDVINTGSDKPDS